MFDEKFISVASLKEIANEAPSEGVSVGITRPKSLVADMFICGLALSALGLVGPNSTCLDDSLSSMLGSTSNGLKDPLGRTLGA